MSIILDWFSPQKNEGDRTYAFFIAYLNTDVKTAKQLQLSSRADISLLSTITLCLLEINHIMSPLLPYTHTTLTLLSPSTTQVTNSPG